jgi:hypothetical protein
MDWKRTPTTLAAALAGIVLLAMAPGAAMPASAAAAPEVGAGVFEGSFTGTAYGDNGTKAPLWLEIAQDGPQLAATATLGEGMYVGTPFCGGGEVPSGTVTGTAEVDAKNPTRVQTFVSFDVEGIPVNMAIQGDLSEDGQSLAAKTKLSLPFFCGSNPEFVGTLARVA